MPIHFESANKRQRKSEAVKYQSQLVDMGITDPTTLNRAVLQYIETGIPAIPLTRETRTNTSPGSVRYEGGTAISELPDTEVSVSPTTLGKQFSAFNKQTGDITPLGISGDQNVLAYDPSVAQEKSPMTYFIDAGGNVVKSMPRVGSSDQFIPLSNLAPKQAGADKMSQLEKIAWDSYWRAAGRTDKNGNPIPVNLDLQNAAVEIAKKYGLGTRNKEVLLEKAPWYKPWAADTMGSEKIPAFTGNQDESAVSQQIPDNNTKIMEFLKQRGAAVNPLNIEWAKKRLGL